MTHSRLLPTIGGIATLMIASFSQSALAGEYTIEPRDQSVNESTTLDLKGMLRDQHGRRKFRHSQLNHIDIYSRGHALARLHIDGDDRDQGNIEGRRYRNEPLRLFNHGDSNGRWELKIRGDAKIYRIVADVSLQGEAVPGPIGNDWGVFTPPPWNPKTPPWIQNNPPGNDGWELQPYCNCQTGKRCWVRHRNGRREVGQCVYKCPNGCRNPSR